MGETSSARECLDDDDSKVSGRTSQGPNRESNWQQRELCDYMLANSENLVKNREIKDEGLTCGDCGQMFTSETNLKLHRRSHKLRYFCDQCSFKTTLKRCLVKHVQIHIEGISTVTKQHKCTQCEFLTKFVSKLKKHMKDAHNEKDPDTQPRRKEESIFSILNILGLVLALDQT